MSNIDIIQGIIFLIILGVQSGIFYNKVENLKEDISDLNDEMSDIKKQHEREISALEKEHQSIKITMVNTPAKEDITKLTTEVHHLKVTLVRLEVILEHLAINAGLQIKTDKRHADT
jgi:Arc/MetJ-type ribon-helix-helix transcriptional regulator